MADNADEAPAAAEGSTVYIGRLPPVTRDSDLQDAFTKFGSIRALRNVTQRNGQCRGFAFIDYTEPSGAENAIKAMDQATFLGVTISVERMRRKLGDGMRRAPRPRQREYDPYGPRRDRSPPRDYGYAYGYGYGYAPYPPPYDQYYQRDRLPDRDRRPRIADGGYY